MDKVKGKTKMKRWMTGMLALVLMMAAVPAQAQTGGHPCFDLPQADCDILVAAGDNVAEMTSFAFLYRVDFSATGLMPLALFVDVPEAIRFSSEGDGRFAIGDDSPADFWLNLNATSDRGESDLEITIADGVFYVRDINADDGTIGVPLDAESIRTLLDSLGLPIELPLESFLEGSPENFGEFIQRETIGTRLNPSNTDISPYATLERREDLSLSVGGTLQEFMLTVDVSALLQSPEFGQLLGVLMGQAADDPSLGFILQLLPTLLTQVDSVLYAIQFVDADTGNVQAITLDFQFTFDINAALSPNSTGGEPVDVRLAFNLTFFDVNQAQPIIAPEDAFMLSMDAVIGLLNR
jgi:hypothetical protein